MRALFLGAALLGCGGAMMSAPAPRVSCPGCRDGVRLAVGQPIEVTTSWSGSCEPSKLDLLLSKNSDTETAPVSCGGAQYGVTVRCAGACRLTDASGSGSPQGSQRGHGSVYVAPLVPGPFSFEVRIQHAGTGEEKSFASPELMVRAPDGVGLYCHVPPEQRGWPDSDNVGFLTPCDGRPLSGAEPLVMPVAQFDGRTYLAADATLNGRADWPYHELRLTAEYTKLRSLRDPLPGARAWRAAGGGALRGDRRPGRAEVDLPARGGAVRAIALLALVGAGGCFAVGALSATTYTTLACEPCRLPVVATGQSIDVELEWPCSDEQESDGSCDEMVRAVADCGALGCTQEYDGLGGGHGLLRVRVTAPGELTLRVTYTDGIKTRAESFGPVRVVAPDRVELACWARAPGETEYRRCDAGVRAGDDVRVDALALAGEARLDTRPDVEIDGTVLPPGQRETDAAWYCYPALSTPGGPGPATTCVAYALAAGPHTIRTRLADLASELTLQVDTEASE